MRSRCTPSTCRSLSLALAAGLVGAATAPPPPKSASSSPTDADYSGFDLQHRQGRRSQRLPGGLPRRQRLPGLHLQHQSRLVLPEIRLRRPRRHAPAPSPAASSPPSTSRLRWSASASPSSTSSPQQPDRRSRAPRSATCTRRYPVAPRLPRRCTAGGVLLPRRPVRRRRQRASARRWPSPTTMSARGSTTRWPAFAAIRRTIPTRTRRTPTPAPARSTPISAPKRLPTAPRRSPISAKRSPSANTGCRRSAPTARASPSSDDAAVRDRLRQGGRRARLPRPVARGRSRQRRRRRFASSSPTRSLSSAPTLPTS